MTVPFFLGQVQRLQRRNFSANSFAQISADYADKKRNRLKTFCISDLPYPRKQ